MSALSFLFGPNKGCDICKVCERPTTDIGIRKEIIRWEWDSSVAGQIYWGRFYSCTCGIVPWWLTMSKGQLAHRVANRQAKADYLRRTGVS